MKKDFYIEINSHQRNHDGEKICGDVFLSRYIREEDRILLCSDGVTQSGMGSKNYPFGWDRENVADYSIRLVKSDASISAAMLAGKIVTMAHKHDEYKARDDISCAIVYFREPANC